MSIWQAGSLRGCTAIWDAPANRAPGIDIHNLDTAVPIGLKPWNPKVGGMLPAVSNGYGKELIVPALTLGTAASAILARLTRSSMLDVLSRDYLRTARSKGLRERVVVMGHALRNALIPVVTVIGLEFGGLLAGAVIIEAVFHRQGLGLRLIDAIIDRDYPVVQGLVLISAVIYAVANLLVDVLYTYIDPRVRLETKGS